MEIIPINTAGEQRLPWHKPQVQRLVVSLGTQSSTGSGEDLLNEEGPAG